MANIEEINVSVETIAISDLTKMLTEIYKSNKIMVEDIHFMWEKGKIINVNLSIGLNE